MEKATEFTVAGKTIDTGNAEVRSGETSVPLTAKELILIKKLWENRNRIVTNDALCLAAWGEDYYGHEKQPYGTHKAFAGKDRKRAVFPAAYCNGKGARI